MNETLNRHTANKLDLSLFSHLQENKKRKHISKSPKNNLCSNITVSSMFRAKVAVNQLLKELELSE